LKVKQIVVTTALIVAGSMLAAKVAPALIGTDPADYDGPFSKGALAAAAVTAVALIVGRGIVAKGV
jgi:hypothetical protein